MRAMAAVRPSLPSPPPSTYSVVERHGSTTLTPGRELSSNELSYYLPSRGDGVNDMYLHLGFRAPESLIQPARLHAIWATQRLRHPLLAAHIVPGPDVSSARFEYARPETVDKAIQIAAQESDIRTSSKDDLLSTYLNGPRLLSPTRTSFLILARDPEGGGEWHLLICALHCIGDGMALHSCAHEILTLLGQGDGVEELHKVVAQELEKRIDIPRSMEASLPQLANGLKSAAAMINEDLVAKKQIGGQAFPKTKGERKTVVPTIAFDEEHTKRILASCKAHGVSVSNAVFALCNIVWARMLARGSVTAECGPKLPSLLYTALNTRPWLDQQSKSESFFRLCIGYFNVIFPSFIPSDQNAAARTFWHRARLAKSQSTKAVKSPFVVARTQITASKRAAQSIKWAKIDDEAAGASKRAQTGIVTPAATPKIEKELSLPKPKTEQTAAPKPAPSTALMGLSLLGNLDAVYKHASYGGVKLHTLTTGSRQRAGAMLLFSYTFVGKLWLSLGYDQNGFKQGVVEAFWKEMLDGVDDILGA